MKIEKIKTFFICIGAFIAGIFGFILRDLLQGKRDTANENRARTEELKRQSDTQQSENRRVVEAAREQQSNNGEAITGIDEASDIIREIRTKQQIVEDSNALDEWYCSQLFSDNNSSTNRKINNIGETKWK